MFKFETEQKVCEIGGVKFGGQPGEYPTVICSSIFQKGDRVFEGKRKEGFDEKRAEALLKTQDQLASDTGIPGMADIVANTGKEFERFIDFVTSVTDMPFCIDAWVLKPKLEAAAYCAEKGLLDRMFYIADRRKTRAAGCLRPGRPDAQRSRDRHPAAAGCHRQGRCRI